MTFVDVGQGDCTFIRSPEGKNMVIDGGGSYGLSKKYDVGKNIVVPFLLDLGVREIDTMILTHSHNDHLEGLIDIVNNFKVNNLVYGVYDENNPDFKGLIKLCKTRGIIINSVVDGNNIKFTNDITLSILNPQRNVVYMEQNDNSVVTRLNYGRRSIMFTGDISQNIDNSFNDKTSKDILKCDILKVAHHGSKTSSSIELLDNIKPKFSIISVGKNMFGHPNKDVLQRLENINSKVYRTDKDGAITIRIYKNGEMKINKFN